MKKGDQVGFAYLLRDCIRAICNLWLKLRLLGLSEAEIRPDKIRYYLERRDLEFIPKMKEVLVVYREVAMAASEGVKNAEGKTVYTVSVDAPAPIHSGKFTEVRARSARRS